MWRELATFVGPAGRRLLLEEKLDGANLGLSLSKDFQVLCQNRSHYVNSQTHSQFKGLDEWIAQHQTALWEILEPERHVVLGSHSIA